MLSRFFASGWAWLRRRWTAVSTTTRMGWLAAVALVVSGCVALAVYHRNPSPELAPVVADEGDAILAIEPSLSRPSVRRLVIGQILLETVVGAQEVQPQGTDLAALPNLDATSSSGEQDSDDGLFLGLIGEGIALQPALSPACVVRVWSGKSVIGSADGCEADGTYSVALAGPLVAPAWLEIEIPQRLRGVIDLAIDDPQSWPLVAPTVALGYGFELTGLIRDEAGHPVMDAALEARPLVLNAGSDEASVLEEQTPAWQTRSRADGSFVWESLPAGPLRVWVRRSGFAETIFDLDVPARDVALTLPARFNMEGSVALVAGAPPLNLADVSIRVEGSSLSPAVQVLADARGRFKVPDLTQGVFALDATWVAKAGTTSTTDYASLPLENVAPDRQLNLVLLPAYRAQVSVMQREGRPVAGAQVQVFRDQVGVLGRRCQTDAQGRCEVVGLVDGSYWAFVQAADALPNEGQWFEISGRSAKVTLELLPPGEIAGKVVDARGREVEQATVAVVARVGGGLVHASEAPNASGTVAASASTLPPAWASSAPSDTMLGVTVGDVPALKISALASAGVSMKDSSADAASAAVVAVLTSTSDGTFHLGDLLSGTYQVWASHPDFAHAAPIDIQVAAGERTPAIAVVLREGQAVRGRLINDNGQPIEGARVTVDGQELVVSDSHGVFDLGRRVDRVDVRVWAEGYRGLVETLQIDDEAIEVEWVLVAASGRLLARVVDGLGQTIAGARVDIREPEGRMPDVETLSDDRGVATFEGLALGPVHVVVNHPDYGEVAQEVVIGPEEAVIEVTLSRGFALKVEVTDARSREPIVAGEVTLGERTLPTDRTGTVDFSHLRGDGRLLMISRAGYVTQRFRIESEDLRDGQGGLVQVALERAGEVVGEVIDDRGEPVASVTVLVRLRDGGEVTTQTRRDGSYTLPGLPDGEVILEFYPPASQPELQAGQMPVLVRREETREVDRMVLSSN